jgi:predicted O-methyltransferase YrrM
MRRLLRNLLRLPARTWTSLSRLGSPAVRLQRRATRSVMGWLDAVRRDALLEVPGFSSERELHLLAYLVRQAPVTGSIVEIGAYKGRSTVWLVEAAEKRSDRPRVISIDPHLRGTWPTFCDVQKRFRLAERGLEVVRDYSSDAGQAWSRPIALLWVDGSHEYSHVVKDIDQFVPHVVAGGWIVFDDAHGGKFPDVERAIAERMIGRADFEHIGVVKHFQLFRRRAARAVA